MTYAIIETGGKQIRVEPGRFYEIEKLDAETDTTITIDKVLLVNHEGEVTIGQPFIDGANVAGTLVQHRRGRKILVYKMRPKKKTRKKRGHRQDITRLMIDSISLHGVVIAKNESTQLSPAPEVLAEESSTIETTEAIETEVVAEAAANT